MDRGRERHRRGGGVMTSFPPLARAAELLGGEVHNGKILCPGPGHSDADRSLSVKLTEDDHEGFITHSFANDDWKNCREHVRKMVGLLEPKSTTGKTDQGKNSNRKFWKFVEEYIYPDANGAPYMLVKRYIDEHGKKQFPQYHWDGLRWQKGKPHGPKIPYRLPELLAAAPDTAIYLVEGEACANSATKIGLMATTASEGCSAKWAPELTPYFKNRRVVIVVDSDTGGREHGHKVARALYGVAASVKIVDLYPERDDGSDVADWLKTDKAGVKLMKAVNNAPVWEPSAGDAEDETGDEVKSDVQDDELIAELATLSRLQYAKRRKKAAKHLGITAGELDKIVAEARSEPPSEEPAHWHVERWPEPVATADILADLAEVYSRYAVLPEHGATAMAMWNLHAWAIDAFYCSPFLMFSSPEMRCGKSTAMSLIYWTGPRTVLASNISPAAIFRYIDAEHPTLLTDEAETNENEEARGILNSGHTRDTAHVIRCEGDENKPKRFSTWAPKALASIGKLAATLRDRAVIISMKRKKRGECVEKLRGRDTDEFRNLRERAQRWADDNIEKLKNAQPVLPDGLNDRAADNWEPFLAIAELAGGDWPARARAAAVKLSGDADSLAETIGVQLLGAIKMVFESLGVDRITSEALAEELAKDKNSLWAAYGKTGKPITQRQIAALLDRYGIRPDSIRISGFGTKKGYLLAWLEDAFETYLDVFPDTPPSDPGHRNKPAATDTSSTFSPGTPEGLFRAENSEKCNNGAPCSGVPDRTTPRGEKQENIVSTLSEPCVQDRAIARPEGGNAVAEDVLDIPTFLRRCDHCGQLATPANLLNPWDWPDRPNGIWLHAGCEELWFDTQGTPDAPCRAVAHPPLHAPLDHAPSGGRRPVPQNLHPRLTAQQHFQSIAQIEHKRSI
jgi:hypothetical protein